VKAVANAFGVDVGEAMMTDAQIPSPADAQAAYWNSPAARPWAEQYERQDRALASLATAALDLAAPQPGEHVLDIGCGSGTTVLALATRVGPRGHVLGADIAEPSVGRGRAHASPPPGYGTPR
jgi:cyclopropane fatty-acyl-phospholipid synthase-like methyltransferase